MEGGRPVSVVSSGRSGIRLAAAEAILDAGQAAARLGPRGSRFDNAARPRFPPLTARIFASSAG